MKKYRLLIESAEYPKGTIAEYSSLDEAYVLTYIGSRNSGTATAETWQIENRPEVWEEIVEQAEEQTEVQNEYLPFQPKKGEEYRYVSQSFGDTIIGRAYDSEGGHNVFRTKKAAEYEKLRQESMSKRWKPQKGEPYWHYSFRYSEACQDVFTNHEIDTHRYFIGNVHKTKGEAESWGKKYSEAWRVLL